MRAGRCLGEGLALLVSGLALGGVAVGLHHVAGVPAWAVEGGLMVLALVGLGVGGWALVQMHRARHDDDAWP